MFRVPLWSNWREVRSPSTRWKRNNFPMGCNGQRYLCGNGEEEGRVTEIFGHWTAAQVSNEEKNFERIFVFLYLTFRINLYLHIFFHNIYKAMLNFKFKKIQSKWLSFNMGEVIWCLRSWPAKKRYNFQERGN